MEPVKEGLEDDDEEQDDGEGEIGDGRVGLAERAPGDEAEDRGDEEERTKAGKEVEEDLAGPVDPGGRDDVAAVGREAASDDLVVETGLRGDAEPLRDLVRIEGVPVERGEVVEVLALLLGRERRLGRGAALGDLDPVA